jgi:hypothetical protein
MARHIMGVDRRDEMTMDPNAFLMGSGGRSASFKAIGDKVSGFITNMEVRQQSDIDGELKFWDDGKPRMQLVVTLETLLAEGDDDDGLRKLYVKGQMTKAVQDAVRKAGQKGLKEGGQLVVKYDKDEPSAKRGYSATKVYVARYEPPQQTVPDDEDEPF